LPIKKTRLVLFLLIFSWTAAFAKYPDDRPWSIFLYRGETAKETLGELIGMEFTPCGETIYTAELGYSLSKENRLRRYLQPLTDTVAVNGNVTYRDDLNGPIYEFIGFISFRWTHFPWDRYIANTIAVGWGLSYTTNIITEEQDCEIPKDKAKRLLNYLMFEATIALPSYPQWQLAFRLHHRSGAYGLFHSGNSDSQAIGFGIRYNF